MPDNLVRPFTAASFNQYLAEHKLMGTRCPSCDRVYLPPRAICPECHGDALAWVELAGRGRLAAFTSIYVGPSAMIAEGYDRNNPYVSGIIETEEGAKISARILGVDAKHPDVVWIGTPLTVAFLDRDEGEQKSTVLAFTAD
jgi:uncharacterized OB-fold protein